MRKMPTILSLKFSCQKECEFMEEFKRVTNAFNYVFERTIAAGEVIILKLPLVAVPFVRKYWLA